MKQLSYSPSLGSKQYYNNNDDNDNRKKSIEIQKYNSQ